jgi:hypothetical protein
MSLEPSRGRITEMSFHTHSVNWPDLEADVKSWITEHGNNGIILMGQLLGVTYL